MEKPTPRFSLTLRQLLESVFWSSVGLGVLKACYSMSQETMNTLWIFAFLLPGAAFGAAIGSLVGRHRLVFSVFGLLAWIGVLFAWTLVFR